MLKGLAKKVSVAFKFSGPFQFEASTVVPQMWSSLNRLLHTGSSLIFCFAHRPVDTAENSVFFLRQGDHPPTAGTKRHALALLRRAHERSRREGKCTVVRSRNAIARSIVLSDRQEK